MKKKFKIMIVDSNPKFAYGVAACIKRCGYETVDHFPTNGVAAISIARKTLPDAVFIEIGMSGELDGIQTIQLLKRQLQILAVFVTEENDQRTLLRAKRVNPKWFINKPLREEDVRTCLAMIFNNATDIQESSGEYRVEKNAEQGLCNDVAHLYSLSRAEARVIVAFAKNPTTAMVAHSLHLSQATIQTHLKHIYRKTGINGRTVLLHEIFTGGLATSFLKHLRDSQQGSMSL